MKTYYVSVPEVHYATYQVTAENKRDAVNRCLEDGILLDNLEYAETLTNGEKPWYIMDAKDYHKVDPPTTDYLVMP